MHTMNNTFSLHRFGLLFKKNFSANSRRVLKPLIIISAIYVILKVLLCFLGYVSMTTFISMMNIYIAFALLVLMTPFLFYSKFNDKRYGIIEAMLPASHLEKFFSKFVMLVVLFPVLFILIIIGLDYIVSAFFGQPGSISVMHDFITEHHDIIEQLTILNSYFFYFIVSLFALQALFLLGVHFFKSHRVSKSIISVLILSQLISILAAPFTIKMLPEIMEKSKIVGTANPTNLMDMINNITPTWIFNYQLIVAIFEILIAWFLIYRIIKTHKYY